MYKIKKAFKQDGNNFIINWFICNPIIPDYQLCKFLDLKGKQSKHTQQTYASILVQYLNFLHTKRNKFYYEISYDDLKKYFHNLIFFNKNGQYIITPDITYKTLKMKHTVLNEFYQYLEGEGIDLKLNIKQLNKSGLNAIKLYMVKYKKSRKENYIMEYSTDEIQILMSNLNSLRNKAVFLLTLFGMRIDEVLSIYLMDFNFQQNSVQPSRSKTIKNRIIVISEDASSLIQQYIQTERLNAVISSGIDSEYLFVNINQGLNCGKPLKYPTFYKALKRAGLNAGFKTEQIRTHSGRSTRTMKLLKANVSDEIIRHILGWRSPTSIKDYLDEQNKSLALKGAKFLAHINHKNSNDDRS